jgi:hypothetical protein
VFESLRMLLLTANYSASVLLLPFASYKTLSIDNKLCANHRQSPFLYLYLKYWCNPFFLFRYQNSLNRFIEIQWADELLLVLHALSCAAAIAFATVRDNYLSTVLTFSAVVLVFVLLKLMIVVYILDFEHVSSSVLELRGGTLATMQAIVELALVTWNLLVTITTAHDK